MGIADKLEYRFRRYLSQKTPACSTYAFLGVMAELVENKTGIPTDFEYADEYKKINNGRSLMRRIANKSVETGFVTIDNRRVKATKVIHIGKYGVKDNQLLVDKLCRNIQAYSPCIATFRYNKETSLMHNKNLVLDKVYKYIRKWKRGENKAHEIAITGFDRQKKLFTLSNSWGAKRSHRYIRFEDISKIFSGGYFVEDVIITKI